MMVHLRKRLSVNVTNEINELVKSSAAKSRIAGEKDRTENSDDEQPPGPGGGKPDNAGTKAVNATVAPEEMRFSHDVTTLYEA